MANSLKTEQKVLAVSMLAEGNTIRSIERVTGIHRDTIMRLGVHIGQACKQTMDSKMRNLTCRHIEVDEIWGFIGKKEKRATSKESMLVGLGDGWVFIGLCADSKIIPSFVVGRRDAYHAKAFMDDLASRLKYRP